MKDRSIQSPIPYSTGEVTGIKPNVLSQSVMGIMSTNRKEHCAHKQISDNPFAPVGLAKDGAR